jgi:hypothetical protein
VLAGLGESLPIIGKTLGHRQTATTQRYAHLEMILSATRSSGPARRSWAWRESRDAEVVKLTKL